MMPKITIRFFIFSGLLLSAAVAKGQDPHFAGVQDMNIWYNPALKTNKVPLSHISLRTVKYPNIISYNSKAITFELPMVGKEKTDYDNISFVNLAIGINTDNSTERFMTASTAMLSLSFALPLDYNNTYLAIGFQGNYSFNRVGAYAFYNFPVPFDKYGALGWAMTIDPYQSGYNYGYLTAGTGLALFHSGEQQQWYLGGSVRHFNHPYTEWSYSVRLPSGEGLQAGYTASLSPSNDISGYGNFTWQAGTHEQFVGARCTHHLNDSTNNAVSLGIGYRAGDALVPDAGLQIGASRVAFYYEISLPGSYHRKATGFSYRLNF